MGIKLTVPISHLFKDSTVSRTIIANCDCLEGREKRDGNTQAIQCLFHFDANIVCAWGAEEREYIRSVLLTHGELEVISFHILASCTKPVLDGYIFKSGGRKLSEREMFDNTRHNIDWLKSLVGRRNITIALENINYYPTAAYRHVTEASFIDHIIRTNDISFLFDLAHARITAHNAKISYREYRSRLPMDRVIQVHLSRYAVNDEGLAYDAHALPDEEVFREVSEVVRLFSPLYLTIEYYKDSEGLIETLRQYRGLCAEPNEVTM